MILLTLTGLVGLYEICFEQSWKAMKEILERDGFAEGQTGSPRQVIKTAYQAGMLQNEELWLDALDIIRGTKDKYYNMFGDFKKKIEDEWITSK